MCECHFLNRKIVLIQVCVDCSFSKLENNTTHMGVGVGVGVSGGVGVVVSV